MSQVWRSGDVLIIATDEPVPAGAAPVPRDNGRVVLVCGEIKGPFPALSGSHVELFAPTDRGVEDRFLAIVGAEAVLTHEKHDPIVLPPGVYRVRRRGVRVAGAGVGGRPEPVAGKKIERLAPGQEAVLAVVRQEWVANGVATGPADRQAAERGVADAYRAGGLQPPGTVVWLGSPFAGAVCAWMFDAVCEFLDRDRAWLTVREQVRHQVEAQLWDVVDDQVGDQVEEQIRNQVRNRVWDQIETPVQHQIEDRISAQNSPHRYEAEAEAWARARAQVVAGVWAEIRDQIGSRGHEQIRLRGGPRIWQDCDYEFLIPCGQQHDAGDLAYYDAFRRLGVDGCERLTGLMTVARNAGWWWPFRDAVVLTERPAELHRDDQGRLHHPTGPAVRYPDGFAVYAWHGVQVDEHIVTGDLTGTDWLAERDTEVRRVIAERLGCQRLLDQVQAERRHSDDHGTLWRIPDPTEDDEDIWLVEVINSTPEPDGSFKRYVLRVPPHTPTAHAAVAWTFNLPPEDYQPTTQT